MDQELKTVLERLISETPPPTSEKSITISADDRRTLERLFGRNLNNAQDLIHIVERIVTFELQDAQVFLSPNLLSRLKSRCIGMDFDKFLQLTIVRLLEEYCGLR